MTLTEIAEYANVSAGTVDRVIHNRTGVSAKTKKKIEDIIAQYGYQPNPIAKQLKTNKPYVIGVLLPPPGTGGGYYEALVQGIQNAAEELKAFKIEIKYAYFTRTIPGEAYRKGKELIESGIDALITMPVIPQEFLDLMPELESIPYVFVDTPLGGTQPLLTIAQNPYRGGYCAGKIMKLIRGSGTYACIRMFQSAYNLRERVRGFSDFFANDSGSKTFDTVCPESTEPGIYAFMDNLFKENPDITGVFVPHAEVYLVGNYIVNAGLKDKVTVIGYDLMDKNKAGIKDGNIDCVIGQRPINQGSDAVYKLYQSGILHQEIPEQIDIPIDIFFKENII